MAHSEPPSGRDELPPLADDGLPTLPTGEPVLARWFVIAMLALVPVAAGVTIWALASIPEGGIAPEERRPPGTAEVTYDRGEAVLNETREREPAPECGQQVELVGDEGALAAGRVAVRATCQALAITGLDQARDGLRELAGGALRFAVFERSGVESSTRIEDGRPVVELNAKFQFQDAARAAPVLVHELTLLGSERFPGAPVSAGDVLAATRAQVRVCEEQGLLDEEEPPRGCRDARALLEEDDPLAELVAAGFPEEA